MFMEDDGAEEPEKSRQKALIMRKQMTGNSQHQVRERFVFFFSSLMSFRMLVCRFYVMLKVSSQTEENYPQKHGEKAYFYAKLNKD